MENKIEMCIMCGDEPVHIQKRHLGLSCWNKIRDNGGLPPLPRKSEKESRENRKKNLIKKYGFGIIMDFDDLNHRPFWNLVDVGNKHGFTREYARQIYKVLYGKAYGKAKVRKTSNRIRSEKSIACTHDPRRKFAEYKRNGSNIWKSALSEKMFFDECEKRGLVSEILCNSEIDLKVSGYFIDVKSSFTPAKPKGAVTPFRHFRISRKQKEKCDFLACYHSGEKAFFIIPKKEFPKSFKLYISEVKTNHYSSKNRYWQYRNAWHQLAHHRGIGG